MLNILILTKDEMTPEAQLREPETRGAGDIAYDQIPNLGDIVRKSDLVVTTSKDTFLVLLDRNGPTGVITRQEFLNLIDLYTTEEK